MTNKAHDTDPRKTRQGNARSPDEQLTENLNWLIGSIRTAVESPAGQELLGRAARLLSSPLIVDGLTTDMEGWAALLGLKGFGSIDKMRTRKSIPAHKPGKKLMLKAEDILRHSVYGGTTDDDSEG